jgi:hypothetical protein
MHQRTLRIARSLQSALPGGHAQRQADAAGCRAQRPVDTPHEGSFREWPFRFPGTTLGDQEAGPFRERSFFVHDNVLVGLGHRPVGWRGGGAATRSWDGDGGLERSEQLRQELLDAGVAIGARDGARGAMLLAEGPGMDTQVSGITGLRPAFLRIEEIEGLGADWDSYGAVPPTPEAISAARRLLHLVAAELGDRVGDRIAPYAVAPLANGGQQLEWRGAAGALEVEIGPHGTSGYLLVEGRGGKRAFQEADEVAWPVLHDLLARVLTP